MPVAKGLSARLCRLMILTALATGSTGHAANGPVESDTRGESVETRFDAAMQETRILGRVTPDLCFVLHLPQLWHAKEEGAEMKLEAASLHAQIQMSLRAASDLRNMPQPDLASRDAAFLQRDYEHLLGRPAQSVSIAPASGAIRWSATWIDANLPAADRALTFEAVIIPLSGQWVLELSLRDVETSGSYDALVLKLLSGFRILDRAAC